MKRILVAAAMVAVACVPALAASDNQPQTFGDWQMQCFPAKSISPCQAIFALVRKSTRQRIDTVSFAFIPSRGSYVMQVGVPLGISLAQGVTLVAGSYQSPKLVVRRCDRSGCFVEGTTDNSLVQGLRAASGSSGQIKVVADAGGTPVNLVLSLKGFSDAMDAMVAAAKDKAVGGTDSSTDQPSSGTP